jgi:hypothetical protein
VKWNLRLRGQWKCESSTETSFSNSASDWISRRLHFGLEVPEISFGDKLRVRSEITKHSVMLRPSIK